jgi:acyl carrier protein
MEEKLFNYIRDTVSKIAGPKDMVMETDFVKDLRLNSYDIMNIVCEFEEHFDTEIPNRDVWQMRQVKDVVAYMIRKGLTDVESR